MDPLQSNSELKSELKENPLWFTRSGDVCLHTVYYCPKCQCQRTWHSIARSLFKCEHCGLRMRHDEHRNRFRLEQANEERRNVW